MATVTREREELIEELKRASMAVFAGFEYEVAKDLSRLYREAAAALAAPPASDPPRLGCESPSNCDPKLDLCTHCQARTAPNGLTPPSWITARQSDPPGLPRYGVTWQEGVSSPLLTPMADGYWTPWHLAAQAIAARQSDPPGLVANWRPIETAPKRTDVLAGWADRPHWLPQVLQQDDAGMWFNGEESDYRPPTHWMPLPASPQAETMPTHFIVGRVDHGDDTVTTACGRTLDTWDRPVAKGMATYDRDLVTCEACNAASPQAETKRDE